MHLSISSVHTLDCRGLSLQAKCQVLGTCWAARDVRSCHLGTYKRHRGRGGVGGKQNKAEGGMPQGEGLLVLLRGQGRPF